MIVCGVCLLITIIYGIFGRISPPGWEKRKLMKLLLLLEAAGMLVSGIEYWKSGDSSAGIIIRNDAGKGDLQVEREIVLEGESGNLEFVMTIPEMRLTAAETEAAFAKAEQEVEDTFPGDNADCNHILSDVEMKDSYAEGLVTASWLLSSYDHVDSFGKISNENLEEPCVVEATVTFSCEGQERVYKFGFAVLPPELTAQEQLILGIKEKISRIIEADASGKSIELPTTIGDKTIRWKETSQNLGIKLMLLGVAAVFAVGYGRVLEARKKEEERRDKLKAEYAGMVSTMTLLLGAGMSIRKAWERIVCQYENGHPEENLAYEEMQITLRQMQGGTPETTAISQFGQRCQVQSYKKYSGLLLQYLQKGSRDIGQHLNEEVRLAFEERKALAKIQGEKAGTKLLMPMILLLAIVLVIILVPALLSFAI